MGRRPFCVRDDTRSATPNLATEEHAGGGGSQSHQEARLEQGRLFHEPMPTGRHLLQVGTAAQPTLGVRGHSSPVIDEALPPANRPAGLFGASIARPRRRAGVSLFSNRLTGARLKAEAQEKGRRGDVGPGFDAWSSRIGYCMWRAPTIPCCKLEVAEPLVKVVTWTNVGTWA